jgi:hypothetical protein
VYGHAYKIFFGKTRRKYLMEELTVDCDIILKWILNRESEYVQDLFGSG